MNQKPLIQGGLEPVLGSSQDDYRMEMDKRQRQQQQQQQRQQQQQQQQHRKEQQFQFQYHSHQNQVQYPYLTNPAHRQYWIKPDEGNSSATTRQNFDMNNPYHTSDGRRLVAPAVPAPSPYQNQDALQQLEKNLRLVLKQQRQQQHPQELQRQGTISMMKAEYSHKNVEENCDSSTRIRQIVGQQSCGIPPPPISNAHYPGSSGDSTAPSLTEERTTTNSINASSIDNNGTKQLELCNAPTVRSYSSLLPSPSINSTSNGLFALGDEVQPLSIASHQKETRAPASATVSSDALLGSWSDEANTEEVANDIFMDNLFHAELRMSRQNKSADTDSKLKLPSMESDPTLQPHLYPCSKVDESVEPLPSTSENVILRKEIKLENSCHKVPKPQPRHCSPKLKDEPTNISEGLSEILPRKQSKDLVKTSRKKKSKHGLSSSKSKQKRKTPLKRKPKFPLLQEDPPIEEQILSLPPIVLAPSLLASIVTNDPKYHQKIPNGKIGQNCVPQPTLNIGIRRRKRSNTYSDAKHVSDDVGGCNDVSPIETFRKILKARGHAEIYSFDLEGTEYDVVPSPLQLASYGTYLVWAIQSSDPSLVRKLLSCGLSPNPCNQFRDSILGDLICKQGNVPMYECFVNEFNADLRLVDGFGRTLLHHCCWGHELCRPIAEDILQRDPIQIFLKDKQEKTPLEYICPDNYRAWNTFLEEVADKYWSKESTLPKLSTPFGGRRQPNGDLVDPRKALTPALAAGIASGNITAEALSSMSELSRKTYGKE